MTSKTWVADPYQVCSVPFLRKLTQELAEQFHAQTGLDLLEIPLHLAFPPQIRFDWISKNDYIEADLIGPDNFGHSVRIAWTCKAHPGESIRPSNLLDQDEHHQIHFWWDELPAEKLKKAYLKAEPYSLDAGFLSFTVEWSPWWPSNLPDFTLELYSQYPITDEALQQAEQLLLQTASNVSQSTIEAIDLEENAEDNDLWGYDREEVEQFSSQGYVKYYGGLTRLSPQSFLLTLDFALTGKTIIIHWIHALEHIRELIALERVKII
jgi:hypothetical protein